MLLLLAGTSITDNNNQPAVVSEPFDMYRWHYGSANNGNVRVADLCGRNADGDNAFIHVRKETSGLTEVVFWVYDDTLKKDDSYTISTKFDNETKTFKAQLRLGGKGDVLFLDKPLYIIGQMKKYDLFEFFLIRNRDTINNFIFHSPKTLQWD